MRLYETVLADGFETVVVGTNLKYREEWLRPLEAAANVSVVLPDDLPFDPADESGLVIAYMPDV